MNAAAFEAKDGAERHRGPLRILHPAVGAFVVATVRFRKGGGEGGTGKVRLDETKKVPSEIWEGLTDQKATATKIRRISRMPFDIIITKILTGSP